MYKIVFKRLIDLLASSLAMILFAPLLLICSIIIKLTSNGPVFFVQERFGYNGKPFFVYKLRTMIDKVRIPDREVQKGDDELTVVGYFLRRYKIDELPQLFNVILGEMSLVGPRPGLVNQLRELDENGKFRILVKPGLTGLAQVNGNIFLTWKERWEFDRYYVENLGFIMDLKIILKTVLLLIYGEDKFLKRENV